MVIYDIIIIIILFIPYKNIKKILNLSDDLKILYYNNNNLSKLDNLS